MLWEIIFHAEFYDWFFEQEEAVQESIAMVLDILEEQGVLLDRPYVDIIKGLSFPNMKELRVQHAGEPLEPIISEKNLKFSVLFEK